MTRCHARLLILATVVGLVQAVGCDKRPGSSGTSGAETKAAGPADSAASSPANSGSADAKSSAASIPGGLQTAQDVLEKMAAAYKSASSYEDFGSLEFRSAPLEARSDTRFKFSVAFQRPNKLRLELFDGKAVCDGKQWFAACANVPGQVVLREAPAKLSMNVLRADSLLYSALSDNEQFTSPQLLLLLDADPIKSLVYGSQDVSLDEPGRLGDYDCYRVRVDLPEGRNAYLWIDQKTFVLRTLYLPLADGPPPPEGGQAKWLVFNFERPASEAISIRRHFNSTRPATRRRCGSSRRSALTTSWAGNCPISNSSISKAKRGAANRWRARRPCCTSGEATPTRRSR